MMGAVGVGPLVGSLVVVAASGTRRKGRMLLAALLANGVLLMLLGLSSVLSLSVVILLALGFANAIHMATNQTLIQLNVEDQYRGRVLSLHFVGFGLQPIGGLPAGAVAEVWGIQAGIFFLGALLFFFIGMISLRTRRIAAM